MNRLKLALDLRNISQVKFAEMIGINAITLNRYIKGTRTPNANVIVKICKTLNISADWLLELI